MLSNIISHFVAPEAGNGLDQFKLVETHANFFLGALCQRGTSAIAVLSCAISVNCKLCEEFVKICLALSPYNLR